MVANLGDGRAVASVHNMAKALTQVHLIFIVLGEGESGQKMVG